MIKNMIFVLIMATHMSYASASPTSCPARPPDQWHSKGAKLANVRILAYLPGDQLDETALPAAPPDKEWTQSGRFIQAWDIRAGAVYQADCLYSNTERYLRVNLSAGQRCVGRWQTRGGKVIEGTLQFRCG
jgi:hypothetical protein